MMWTGVVGLLENDARRSLRRVWSVTAAAVILGVANGGRAEDGSGPLVLWDVPVECPAAADVLQRLRELAGPRAVEAATEREVRGRIQYAASRRWVLELELRDRRAPQAGVQRRRIEAPRCAELGDAAAVALAISLSADEPIAAEVSTEPSSASGAVTSPAATPLEPEAGSTPGRADAVAANESDVANVTRSRSSVSSGAVGLSGLVDSASLGGVAVGLSVDTELRLGAFGVAGYGLWLPSRHWVVGGDGVTPAYVNFSLLGGGASGCYHGAWGLGDLAGCAGFELGALRAAPRGLAGASVAQDLWLAPSLAAALTWPVGSHLLLASRIGGVFPLGRDDYEVDAGTLVQHTPRLVLRLSVGVQIGWGGR